MGVRTITPRPAGFPWLLLAYAVLVPIALGVYGYFNRPPKAPTLNCVCTPEP